MKIEGGVLDYLCLLNWHAQRCSEYLCGVNFLSNWLYFACGDCCPKWWFAKVATGSGISLCDLTRNGVVVS